MKNSNPTKANSETSQDALLLVMELFGRFRDLFPSSDHILWYPKWQLSVAAASMQAQTW